MNLFEGTRINIPNIYVGAYFVNSNNNLLHQSKLLVDSDTLPKK